MSTYAISDIHGCYEEFMALLEQIQFNPQNDILYVLGDVIDRGERPIDCLEFIRSTKNIHLLMGNHEQMMMEYILDNNFNWMHNGNAATLKQLRQLEENHLQTLLSYVHKRPYYQTVRVGDRRYFLSHSGLDVSKPFKDQQPDSLTWSREEFFLNRALPKYICVFGHTPTVWLRKALPHEREQIDCSVWFDTNYTDKICIDSGCVYGGALAALRLDDGAVFYEMSVGANSGKYSLGTEVVNLFDTAVNEIQT